MLIINDYRFICLQFHYFDWHEVLIEKEQFYEF